MKVTVDMVEQSHFRKLPSFRVGDHVRITLKIVEGESERLQAFEGTVIRLRGHGLSKYTVIAGVDEAGCGPLAGPVVAAAVILPPTCRVTALDDSKQLTADQRQAVYKKIQRMALAIGVGIVEAAEIDRINIRQASF